jgi:hypothetical protein
MVEEKYVINGVKVARPAKDHPHPSHWQALKAVVAERQTDEEGRVHCATCWEHSIPLDLHHRHYNTFGDESPHDVVLLCRLCHEAITSRIRAHRYDVGRWEDPPAQESRREVYRPGTDVVTIETEDASIQVIHERRKWRP